MPKIDKNELKRLYVTKGYSISDIARHFECSENKINYWAKKINLQKRSISEALYLKNNPNGDPFLFKKPQNDSEWFLYGLGLGLYWGEGNKANTHAVRLGNTDPALIKKFLLFLETIYQIDSGKLRFGLQLFTDIDKEKALRYWCGQLEVTRDKFQKVVVTKSVRRGTYLKKSEYGVLTIYFSNIKLRGIIVSAIEKLRAE